MTVPDADPVRKAEYYAARRDWPGYFRAVAGKGPRETLTYALDAFEREDAGGRSITWRAAVDLGCGEGRDTREMLRRAGVTRWKVMATDSSGDACDLLGRSIADRDWSRLNMTLTPMEAMPASFARGVCVGRTGRLVRSADLVNASFSLPFCPPDSFSEVWEWIVRILAPGGRFAGQLFGDRDDWARLPDRSHQSRAEVDRLLSPFQVEMLNEEEKDSNDPGADPKHWHVFHVVARKR
jgi:SAM-dependent methyltransferase